MSKKLCHVAFCLSLIACAGTPAKESEVAKKTPKAIEGPVLLGGDRQTEVFVPASYDENKPAPLVLLLHGFTRSGETVDNWMNIGALANEKGFLFARPDGTKNQRKQRFWNATDSCCNFFESKVDDSAYLRNLIDEIKTRFTVDEKRVFIIGHSNGGFMAYRMACDHADTIAGVVSVAGAMYLDPSLCQPSSPVTVLQIHGTKDKVIKYEGDVPERFKPYPSAIASVETWANFAHCSLTPDLSAAPLDLDRKLEGMETKIRRYATNCDAGGHAELWSIEDGEHAPKLSENFAGEVLEFLLAHPKP